FLAKRSTTPAGARSPCPAKNGRRDTGTQSRFLSASQRLCGCISLGPLGLQQPELLHPVVDLVARQADQLRRPRLGPAGPLEGLHDDVLLEVVELEALRRQRKELLALFRRRGRRAGDGQIVGAYRG